MVTNDATGEIAAEASDGAGDKAGAGAGERSRWWACTHQPGIDSWSCSYSWATRGGGPMSLMRSEQSRKWSKSHRSPTNLLCSIFLVANTHKHLNGAISTNQGDDITSSCISFVALGALLWHHFDEVSYVVPSDAGLNQTREESGKRHRRRPERRLAISLVP